MTYLYLDIETIPAQSEQARERIAATIKPPGNIKKPESILAWEKDSKEAAVQEAIDKTSFDGGLGHVCCIGWAYDDQPPVTCYLDGANNETQILKQFFMRMHEGYTYSAPTIVGHYISGFDIRFLTQRAIVLGIRLPNWWPHEAKPWGNEIFDTMVKWAGAKGTISLDNLCFALGIDGKGDVDGSMIAQMFKDGKHEDIARYCVSDVDKVRQVHRKMIAAFGE